MKIHNPFFKKKKSLYLSDILKSLDLTYIKINKIKIFDITDLINAGPNDISFFNSIKYLEFLKNSKVKYVITHKKYEKLINKICNPILVDDVLKSVSIVSNLFYPTALNDAIDFTVSKPNNKLLKHIKFGRNVLIGKNVKIGSNSIIGHNTIIESNVKIGSNCTIGNNVLIKNSLIGNYVRILDGTILGKKGFGFLPDKKKNIRYPHIGMVIIKDNVEVGCNNTIDRGSISNTVIGKNTFLDNQVHIAHNVNIGENCIITGQVGFAGSSSIGSNVIIGGQAGISGHLKIGNNVQIGGGSGVIKNIPDNTKVMGYPAKDIRSFIKENK
tara:strand:- start:322 stop:1302 length:981 start_codon:yes stop_codon:yes gene_type:complete